MAKFHRKSLELPKKVLIIGSGPIVIGQAAEFDYSGSQACKALREEGIIVVIVNPNPATIQTDGEMADRVYLEPLVPEVVEGIIAREKPDAVLATMGGQSGLNLAFELDRRGVFKKHGVRFLGTGIESIIKGEDREEFKKVMLSIGEPVPESVAVSTLPEALDFSERVGYPLIIRPAYTLGGTGGGRARCKDELVEIVERGLILSPVSQVLIEKDLSGWAELEYEVMRDSYDNCVIICNMENIDPMGIHTGESIVVAPCQTLSDKDIQLFRSASIRIARALGIIGSCNVQFAFNQQTGDYYVIEVNPRLSRSSALASKATGYPIARVAAKVSLGYPLYEVDNKITGTTAGFEPTLDYCVVKIPKWPFYKMPHIERSIGTQMKSTGEVMSIGRTFEEALNKAVASLEMKIPQIQESEIISHLETPTDLRLFALFEALRLGWSVEKLHSHTKINPWFLHKMLNIVKQEQKLKTTLLNDLLLLESKKLGMSDISISRLKDSSDSAIRSMRVQSGTVAGFKMVDSCGGEFQAITPYYYSSYESEGETRKTAKKKILVIGAGPIRIGQGIEFDYCSVHSSIAIQELGFESIMLNSNPETVSTDFDTSDKLYFEPVTAEKVMDIVDSEGIDGIIVQFGGQTSIDIAVALGNGYSSKILGTHVNGIDMASDRERFRTLLNDLGIKQPENGTAGSPEKAVEVAKRIGYPVVVRPSYVIAGRAMEVVFSDSELRDYVKRAIDALGDKPILVDKFIDGVECEVDAICDGNDVFIGGIMEHVEKAGIHSGDAYSVVPPISLDSEIQKKLTDFSVKIAKGLGIVGLINIQYIVKGGEIYVLEANPRASRTVPYLSKAIGYPMAKLATKVMLGQKLKNLGVPLIPKLSHYSVKGVVFPFIKLRGLDYVLGPEMKSTGETMGMANDFETAFFKAMLSANPSLINIVRNIRQSKGFGIGLSLNPGSKKFAQEIAKSFASLGAVIYATSGTAKAISNGIKPVLVPKLSENPDYNFITLIKNGDISLVINTPKKGKSSYTDGFKIRRYSVEKGIPCITTVETAMALAKALEKESARAMNVCEMHDFLPEGQRAHSKPKKSKS